MTLSREQLQRIKDRYCPCADCEGACDDILDEAAMEGVIAVMDWIKRNAIYSHSPTKEHIVIDRSDWNKLIVGRLGLPSALWIGRSYYLSAVGQ